MAALICGGALKAIQLILCLAAGLPASGAFAQQPPERLNAFTLYGGFRDGGGFQETGSDARLRLDGSAAYTLALDIALDVTRQLQYLVSHQRTALDLSSTGTAAGRLPLRMTTLHLGGTHFFDGPIGRGPYATGGLGATLLDPGAGYSSELRPSLNLGIGWQQPLGARVALRFEARAYFTLVNSSGGLFCSGGCVVAIKGDAVTQGDVMLGLSARF
jgi:hypothetical protein